MRKFHFISLIAFGLIACGESSDSTTSTVKKCFDNSLNQYVTCPGESDCVDPQSGDPIECPPDAMPDAACLAQECVVGTYQCSVNDPTSSQTCLDNGDGCGAWSVAAPCGEGASCQAGVCYQSGSCAPELVCDLPGERICEDGSAWTCTQLNDGTCLQWIPTQDCGEGACHEGECVPLAGSESCNALFACHEGCDGLGEVCSATCQAAATTTAQTNYSAYRDCLGSAECEFFETEALSASYTACVLADCSDTYQRCFGPLGAGSSNCAAIAQCYNQCPTNESDCLGGCSSQGTLSAQVLLFSVLGCGETQCPVHEGSAWTECIEAKCASKWADCVTAP